MPSIDYYFSPLSPYTYLAGMRLEEIANKHHATITYLVVDIVAAFGRTGGQPPGQRHISRQEYRLHDLARQARKVGLPLNLKPAYWPTNPAPASYAIIAANAAKAKGAEGDLGVLIHVLTRCVWADEKDIAEDDVIKACLAEAGFDPALSDADMLSGAETYTANLEKAVAAGVFGAPFYITDTDQRFWGQDRLDDLEACLQGRY